MSTLVFFTHATFSVQSFYYISYVGLHLATAVAENLCTAAVTKYTVGFNNLSTACTFMSSHKYTHCAMSCKTVTV